TSIPLAIRVLSHTDVGRRREREGRERERVRIPENPYNLGVPQSVSPGGPQRRPDWSGSVSAKSPVGVPTGVRQPACTDTLPQCISPGGPCGPTPPGGGRKSVAPESVLESASIYEPGEGEESTLPTSTHLRGDDPFKYRVPPDLAAMLVDERQTSGSSGEGSESSMYSYPASADLKTVRQIMERERERECMETIEEEDRLDAVSPASDKSPPHSKVSIQHDAYGSAPLFSLFVRYAAPNCIALLCVSVIPLIELYFLGLLGGNSLTVAGTLSPLGSLIMAVSQLPSRGSGTIMGQAITAGTQNRVRQALWSSIATALITVAALTLIGTAGSLIFTEGGTDMRPYAMTLCLAGPIGFGSYTLVTSLLRSMGYQALSLLVSVVSAMLMVVLCWVAGPVLDMGIMGPPLSYGLTFLLASIIGVIPIVKVTRPKRLPNRQSFSQIKAVAKAGSPALLMGMATVITMLVLIVVIGNVDGPVDSDTHIAIAVVVNRVASMLVLPSTGVITAAVPILGAAFHANNSERVKQAGKYVILGALAVFVPLWSLVEAVPYTFVSLFSSDSVILDNINTAVRVGNAMRPGYVLLSFGTQLLASAGVGQRGAFLSLIGCVLRIALILIGMTGNWTGVWLGVMFSDLGYGCLGAYAMHTAYKGLNSPVVEGEIKVIQRTQSVSEFV
ncbi:multi antimicrobial extrusion protein, partial [Kipferlia bialata]